MPESSVAKQRRKFDNVTKHVPISTGRRTPRESISQEKGSAINRYRPGPYAISKCVDCDDMPLTISMLHVVMPGTFHVLRVHRGQQR